jgi:hypothetical protein
MSEVPTVFYDRSQGKCNLVLGEDVSLKISCDISVFS